MQVLKFIWLVGFLSVNVTSFGQGCWKEISAGGFHTLAIKQDGSLWAWGNNGNGQLGIGSGTGLHQYLPCKVGNETWIDIISNGNTSMAIRSDSTLWRWGDGIPSLASPVPIQLGMDSNWKSLDGFQGVVALKSDNTLWSYDPQSWYFTQVGNDNDWKTASSGNFHAMAIKQNGTLWAWGNNGSGEYGNGTLISSLTPIQIGTSTNNKKVVCGDDFSMVLKSDSSLWVSGSSYSATNNQWGYLGLGAIESVDTFTQIGTNKWIDISCGRSYAGAIAANHTLWTWGYAGFGVLGIGTSSGNINTPTQVTSQTNWSKVFAGLFTNSVVDNNGNLFSCGHNIFGTVGDGTNIFKGTFVPITCPTNFIAITSTSFTNKICKGDSVTIQFNANGIYSSNVFSLEMSNANGSFSSPYVLGTLAGNSNGNYSIKALIPLSTTTGSQYRFRIKSSVAYAVSEDNGIDVAINPKPIITISTNHCNTAQPTIMATGASTYLWSTSETSSTIFANTNAFTQYTVVGTDSNGCSQSASEHINTLTPTTLSCNTPIVSQHQGLTYGTGYVWFLPQCGVGGIANGQVRKYSFTPSATGMFTFSITSPSGGSISWSYKDANQACEIDNWICIGSTSVANTFSLGPLQAGVEYIISGKAILPGLVSQTITILSDPVTMPTVAATNPICGIASAVLTVTNNLNAAIEWYDAPVGGNLLAITPTYTTPSLSTTHNYWIQAVGGCGNTSARAQVTQIVNPKPEITATASNTKVCKHSNIILSGGGGNTYTWSQGVMNNVSFAITSAATYTVTGVDANNCTNTSTVAISVEELPSIGIVTSEDTLCNGDVTMLSGTGGSAYTWSSGIFDQTPFMPTATTTYTVIGTGAFNCTNTATKTVVVRNCNLNVKLFLQGYYMGAGLMQNVLYNEGIEPYPNMNVDTVTVELHKYFSPYALVETQKGILRTNGTLMLHFNADPNEEYYMAFKHRNHIQSWSGSSAPFLVANTVINFTSNSGKTYGDNVAEVEPNVWAVYSGDINQDQVVDALDYLALDIDLINGSSGYFSTDLNGDGVVDALDYLILDPNIIMGINSITP